MSQLAVVGGKPVVEKADETLFHWPIVNQAMIDAQTKVLVDGNMSGTDIARRFEGEFAKWQGRKYALSHTNGTTSLHAAMYGKILILVDPMLASGASMEIAYKALLSHGTPATVHLCSVIAAPEGIELLQSVMPKETTLWCAAIDDHLNKNKYIVPGLGDAGDLCFGDKL